MVLGSFGVSLLTTFFLIAPAEAADTSREVVLLRSPVPVTATLGERDGHLWHFHIEVAHAGRTEAISTTFFADTYPAAVRHLRKAVAWRKPYLFVVSECGGGNTWSCDIEHVLRIEGESFAKLGPFVVEGETTAATSYDHGYFLDLYDKLEGKAPLSHVGSPNFPIAFRERDGHLALDLEETWRRNRREVLDILAKDGPASREEPCTRDESRMAPLAQALAIARYCDKKDVVGQIFAKAARVLTPDDRERLDQVGQRVFPGELPSEWRDPDWGEQTFDDETP
jgi:hypothetical protein